MTILIIVAATTLFLGCYYLYAERSARLKYALDFIDSLFITSDKVILCKQSQTIELMKSTVKTSRSFVVIYKADDRWRIERNKKKKIALIDAYSGSNLILWQGNTKVKGVELNNAEEVVVLT